MKSDMVYKRYSLECMEKSKPHVSGQLNIYSEDKGTIYRNGKTFRKREQGISSKTTMITLSNNNRGLS